MRRLPILLAGAAAACAAPAIAAALSVAKSSVVVSDPLLGALRPRVIPGAEVDYSLTVTNPLANLLSPVRQVSIGDTIPDSLKLRVTDLARAGSGPVEFADGDLLGLGLSGSGLAYRYVALGDGTDGLDFHDGKNWGYVPVPDANGFDPKVRGLRVTLSGTHATGGSFRLRYRVVVR